MSARIETTNFGSGESLKIERAKGQEAQVDFSNLTYLINHFVFVDAGTPPTLKEKLKSQFIKLKSCSRYTQLNILIGTLLGVNVLALIASVSSAILMTIGAVAFCVLMIGMITTTSLSFASRKASSSLKEEPKQEARLAVQSSKTIRFNTAAEYFAYQKNLGLGCIGFKPA